MSRNSKVHWSRSHSFVNKILQEESCCVYGHLKFCEAKREKKPQIAEWLGVSVFTIYYQIRQMNMGKRTCQGLSNCMKPLIEEVTKEEKSP